MPENRRRQVLETAYEILGARGLEGLHARSVAVAIGINHAAVHYYFPTRAALLEAVASYALDRFEADLAEFRSRVSKNQMLRADFALFSAYCKPSSRFFRVWNSLFVAGQAEPGVRERLRAFTKRWVEVFGESLAPHTGALRSPETVVATLMGLALMAQLETLSGEPGDAVQGVALELGAG